MESSCGVIPENRLKSSAVFRNSGADGEEILKSAKLAHAAENNRGFVVTMTDETYSFFYKNTASSDCTISKIRKLYGIQVKEFFTGAGSINFALMEDGHLFSWWIEPAEDDGYEGFDADIVDPLGRYVSCSAANKMTSFCSPVLVTGSLTGVKIRQVALPGWNKTCTVGLSVGGDVHQWGSPQGRYRHASGRHWMPILIPKEHYGYQEITSIACNDRAGVALTAKGEVINKERFDKGS